MGKLRSPRIKSGVENAKALESEGHWIREIPLLKEQRRVQKGGGRTLDLERRLKGTNNHKRGRGELLQGALIRARIKVQLRGDSAGLRRGRLRQTAIIETGKDRALRREKTESQAAAKGRTRAILTKKLQFFLE